ncbi:MAG: hypothetical protein JXB25_02845 [Deltaproteobacteria bacterium]|nr:hypothetical protein [Deltaproteobacteria bacterium]
MGKTVWVIDDPVLKGVSPLELGAGGEAGAAKGGAAPLSETARKNPACAFSLSLLAWGSGQMYLGRWRQGLFYLGTTVLFFAGIAGVAVCWERVAPLFKAMPELFFVAHGLFLAGLLFWLFNAVEAYYRALRTRGGQFVGVERMIWPLGGSVLFPGWGQFLNGQPRKGIFFLLFGMAGVFSLGALVLIRQVWPLFPIPEQRHLMEICLIGAVALIPLVVLLWLVSIYDAFRAREKFPGSGWRARIAWRSSQDRGFLGELVPHCSALLGLMLAISLGMQFYPKPYYVTALKNLRLEMLHGGMTILPQWVQGILDFLG